MDADQSRFFYTILVMGIVTLCDPLKSHLGGINEAGITRTPNGNRTSGRDIWQEIIQASIQTPGRVLSTLPGLVLVTEKQKQRGQL